MLSERSQTQKIPFASSPRKGRQIYSDRNQISSGWSGAQGRGRDGLKNGMRKVWWQKEVFCLLIVSVVSPVYADAKMHHVVSLKGCSLFVINYTSTNLLKNNTYQIMNTQTLGLDQGLECTS